MWWIPFLLFALGAGASVAVRRREMRPEEKPELPPVVPERPREVVKKVPRLATPADIRVKDIRVELIERGEQDIEFKKPEVWPYPTERPLIPVEITKTPAVIKVEVELENISDEPVKLYFLPAEEYKPGKIEGEEIVIEPGESVVVEFEREIPFKGKVEVVFIGEKGKPAIPEEKLVIPAKIEWFKTITPEEKIELIMKQVKEKVPVTVEPTIYAPEVLRGKKN